MDVIIKLNSKDVGLDKETKIENPMKRTALVVLDEVKLKSGEIMLISIMKKEDYES